jgi:beta-lactamase regulating signal transducer with metallopeptidase domain
MTALSALLGSPAATTLAWTLLHFLWQGAVLAAALLLVTRYARLTADGRYAAGVATLALMLAAPVATFVALSPRVEPIAPAIVPATAAAIDAGVPVQPELLRESAAASAGELSIGAVVVALWAAGVLVLATRLLGGWVLARRLVRRAAAPVAPEIESMAVRIAGRLALDRVVRVAQSSAVAVPVMVGWLKPVVLFPASVLAGLSPTQIEALLAHELAHVRRHDYLVNLLQSAVETMLFYHPAVWWVSRRVRVEREHCCDDLALSVCDRLVYATALSDLAALSAPPRVALAATDGSLLQRVRRILAGEDAEAHGSGWLPVLAVVILASLIVPASMMATAADESPDQVVVEQDVTESRAEHEPLAERRQRAAGVAGGVPGGVPGGVVGGVVGGVLGGVAEGVPVEQERPIRYALELQAEQTRELAEMQRAAEMRLRELERERQQIEEARLESRYRAETLALQAELTALADQRARMKRQVEVGTLNPTELNQVEQQLRMLEQRLRALSTEHELDRRELELRRQQSEQMRELERAMVENERAERSVRSAAERAREIVADRRTTAESVVGQAAPLGREEPIRAGDVLVIDIHGEPDVPRAYTVAADGTIRLPLSRPMRVAGLTAAGVEQEIVKRLSARGLERVAAEVMPRRPRGR